MGSRDLVRSILEGTNNFFCYESREDVKMLMRDLSTGRDDKSRRKLDPGPTFFLETIYRYSQKIAPEGHNKAMLESLLVSAGYNESGEFDPNQTCSKSDEEFCQALCAPYTTVAATVMYPIQKRRRALV